MGKKLAEKKDIATVSNETKNCESNQQENNQKIPGACADNSIMDYLYFH